MRLNPKKSLVFIRSLERVVLSRSLTTLTYLTRHECFLTLHPASCPACSTHQIMDIPQYKIRPRLFLQKQEVAHDASKQWSFLAYQIRLYHLRKEKTSFKTSSLTDADIYYFHNSTRHHCLGTNQFLKSADSSSSRKLYKILCPECLIL